MTVLAVNDIYFQYDDFPILRGLTFEVTERGIFVIIGPNGSGKTTLLKIIAGLLHPDAGKVLINNRESRALSRKSIARSISYVPQEVPLDFPFTVEQTVLMGRSPHLGLLDVERKRDYELAEHAMRFTDVLQFADRPLDRLSGGERQRVMIAKAICQESQIILLDEPTAALDISHQIKIMDFMVQLRQEQGKTVVMVLHDLNLAAMYGDRLLLLKEGAAVKMGPPEEVVTGEILEDCYGCSIEVDENTRAGCPRVNLVSGYARR